MTKEEKQLQELETGFNEHTWALGILDDATASASDKEKAQAIIDKQAAIWDNTEIRIEEIMDIENDEEREKAWEEWEKEDLKQQKTAA